MDHLENHSLQKKITQRKTKRTGGDHCHHQGDHRQCRPEMVDAQVIMPPSNGISGTRHGIWLLQSDRNKSRLWIQMNFYLNPDGPAPLSVLFRRVLPLGS